MMSPAFSDPHQLAPGPTRPSRPHLGNTNPSFSIEKHFVLSPDRYAVVRLSHFLTTMPCAVPLSPRRHTRPRTESREVTRKYDVRLSISNALTGRTNMVTHDLAWLWLAGYTLHVCE